MKGVTFGNHHSYDDFFLILNSKELEAPKPKLETVDVPGADSFLDLTEAFGEVKYNNRKLTFGFSTIVPQSEFMDLFSRIQNVIHGQKKNIILDDDPDFYYVGRISVDKWKADKNIGKITVECECEPYKYKVQKTVIVNSVTTAQTFIFKNLRKRVIPTITVTDSVQITFGGTTYALSAGTYTSSDIIFVEGDNTLTVTGSTTITVEYQEGGL